MDIDDGNFAYRSSTFVERMRYVGGHGRDVMCWCGKILYTVQPDEEDSDERIRLAIREHKERFHLGVGNPSLKQRRNPLPWKTLHVF